MHIIVWVWVFLCVLTGCGPKSASEQARDFVKKSDNYYEQAINSYKSLIVRNKDVDTLSFELGRLFYTHGDFGQAIEQLKKTNFSQAKKLLAVSYFKSGSFTDALEAFGKEDNLDDEGAYYYGLTCERLNLFDKALESYKKIKSPGYLSLASARINSIEKKINLTLIKDLDPAAHKIITQAPSAKEFPQAGALILSSDERIEITPSNTEISSAHYIIKILNERGKENFSEAHIDYDSTYEKVELEYARTIKPDGSVVDVGTRHIRDVSKYMNFPLYSNVRVFIISFPEIAQEAVVEYKFKIYRYQMINKKDFVLSYPLQMQEPVIQANFTVDLPDDRPLFIKKLNEEYNVFGASLTPSLKKGVAHFIYSWQFRNIPQILPENNMPAIVRINPTILLSTFNDWQDIYNWWWKLAKDKIKANEDISAKVKELTRKLTEEEKIKAIYNFCAQKIRYVAVEYGQAGYEPHSAEEIFKNKYGDCKDKAVLLVTMLREAGISAYPALISTREYYDLNADFPAVLFNHCITAVLFQGRIIFIDPTAETCSFGDLPGDDQNRKALLYMEDGFDIKNTPLYPAEHNLIKQDVQLKIKDDESILSKKSVFTFGVYDQAQRYWLLYTPPQLVEEALTTKIQDISIGALLYDYKIDNLNDLNHPVALSYEFGGKDYLIEAGNLRIVPQLANVDTGIVAKEKRAYPLDFNILDSKETIFNIKIPRGYSLQYLPDNVVENSQWLKFSIEYQQLEEWIYFHQKIEVKSNMVSQKEYPEFKDFFERLARKIKQRIVFKKIVPKI